MIVYGAHVATTMVPILAELLEHAGKAPDAAEATIRWQLIAIYMPYLVMPLLLTTYMCTHNAPFSDAAATVRQESKVSHKMP